MYEVIVMCVIFFYVNSNPSPLGYKLILASNRDEFYARETRNLSKWANAEYVYGGIDLETGRTGGTWLAIGGYKNVFKLGALLNLTGEPRPKDSVALNTKINVPTTTTTNKSPASLQNNNFLLGRGMIVSDFVTSTEDSSIEVYNQGLVADCMKYSAFNFVSIEIGTRKKTSNIFVCSNAPVMLNRYEEGKCYGFGNSLPSQPFEKVRYGQQQFENIVRNVLIKNPEYKSFETTQKELIKDLFNLLKCKKKFWPDAELQRRAPNWGECLSALNVGIPHEGYGSRTHSIILIDSNNKINFLEETMAGLDPTGPWIKTHIEKQF